MSDIECETCGATFRAERNPKTGVVTKEWECGWMPCPDLSACMDRYMPPTKKTVVRFSEPGDAL